MLIERHKTLRRWLRRQSGRKPRGSRGTPRSPQGIIELKAEKEARHRTQALSREGRVPQELAKIAFGDGPATGKLKALEMLGKHIGPFTPKEAPEGECEEEIKIEMQKAVGSFIRLKTVAHLSVVRRGCGTCGGL